MCMNHLSVLCVTRVNFAGASFTRKHVTNVLKIFSVGTELFSRIVVFSLSNTFVKVPWGFLHAPLLSLFGWRL